MLYYTNLGSMIQLGYSIGLYYDDSLMIAVVAGDRMLSNSSLDPIDPSSRSDRESLSYQVSYWHTTSGY